MKVLQTSPLPLGYRAQTPSIAKVDHRSIGESRVERARAHPKKLNRYGILRAKSVHATTIATGQKISGVRRGKVAFVPVSAHLGLHVRSNAQIRTRLRGAKQDEPFLAVLRVIADSVARIEVSGFEQLAGARKAAALMAARRENDSRI
jgi:hypothetical protein